MTGPEHYKAAEEILKEIHNMDASSPAAAANLAQAQVHATLALAAASLRDEEEETPKLREWGDRKSVV